MLIDWFTVAAQALNFVLLVWLMKRFLYQPILKAIATRDARIAAELADADATRDEASRERQEYEHKNAVFDQEREALSKKARDAATSEGERLLAEVRLAAEAAGAKRQDALRSEVRNLNQTIARHAQQEVFAIARKALADLATTSLEERLCEVFTRRLRELGGEARDEFARALLSATVTAPALVRSVTDLTAEQRVAIESALNETFSAEVPVRFETSPDLVSGIELIANGQKVGWSIAEYLRSLAKGVGDLVGMDTQPDSAPTPASKEAIPDGA